MSYCILRVAKLRTLGSVAGSAKHTFREIPTPNADPKRTPLNQLIGAKSSEQVCAAIKKRLPEKRRKDAVICIEYLITASPEWWETSGTHERIEYLERAHRWLQDRHGPENIVCVNVQHDETTPHMVAYVVPITRDGRLSAKDFLGGRAKLTQMQSDFHKKVGEPVGLQRGVEGSKAQHTTVKQFYRTVKQNPKLLAPRPQAPSVVDHLTGKAKKMEEEHEVEMARYAAQVEQAKNVALLSRKARQAQEQALKELRDRLEGLEDQQDNVRRLERDNRRLHQAFEAERNKLMEIIRMLWELLLAVLGLSAHWEKQAEQAADEVSSLRNQLKPKPKPTAPKPAPRPTWAKDDA